MINDEKEEKLLDLKLNNMAFKNELKNNIGDEVIFEQLFATIEIVHKEANTIYILVPATFKDIIKSRYHDLISRLIKNILGKQNNVIYITHLDELKYLEVISDEKNNQKKINIRSDLTFENYASGKFNDLVLKAAKTVYQSNDVIFSPLFIYGGSGLGKTHILHAIGNQLLEKGKTCFYVNPDELTRKLVEQLRNRNQEEINKIVDELTSYDCLMFDDIQQYANKESTLSVLFNIINTMITNKKQIILCADKKPEDLGGFEQRFITRFNGGLIVNILNPEMDDVISILKFKLRVNNINPMLWDDESIKFVARNFSSSIRAIEGAINRIILFSQGDEQFSYDIENIKTIFKSMSQVKESITPEKIIEIVAKYYKINKNRIVAKTRKEEVVMARRLAMWFIKNNFNFSLEEIGKMFGNQTHSTVIVSISWIDKNIKTNSSLKVAVENIKDNLSKIL